MQFPTGTFSVVYNSIRANVYYNKVNFLNEDGTLNSGNRRNKYAEESFFNLTVNLSLSKQGATFFTSREEAEVAIPNIALVSLTDGQADPNSDVYFLPTSVQELRPNEFYICISTTVRPFKNSNLAFMYKSRQPLTIDRNQADQFFPSFIICDGI